MASRFWVLGTGTWDASTTTNWAASSGGAGGQSVPGSADTVTFDGSSGGGTVTVNTTVTVQSITCGAFTGTLDFSANNNNVTLSASAAFSGTGSATRTINLGNGTWSLSSTAATTPWNLGLTTNLTFNANSSTIDFTGNMAAGSAQTFSGGGLTYNTVKVSGARFNAGLIILNSGGTITALTNTAAAYISISAALTVTTLTQSAQLTLVAPTGATLTVTNAPTLTGTSSAPLALFNSSGAGSATTATISCASGTFSGTWCAIAGITFSGGATFSFTNSFDNGKNSGATITAPSAGGGSAVQYRPTMNGL